MTPTEDIELARARHALSTADSRPPAEVIAAADVVLLKCQSEATRTVAMELRALAEFRLRRRDRVILVILWIGWTLAMALVVTGLLP